MVLQRRNFTLVAFNKIKIHLLYIGKIFFISENVIHFILCSSGEFSYLIHSFFSIDVILLLNGSDKRPIDISAC